jgi:hypothetical protein
MLGTRANRRLGDASGCWPPSLDRAERFLFYERAAEDQIGQDGEQGNVTPGEEACDAQRPIARRSVDESAS